MIDPEEFLISFVESDNKDTVRQTFEPYSNETWNTLTASYEQDVVGVFSRRIMDEISETAYSLRHTSRYNDYLIFDDRDRAISYIEAKDLWIELTRECWKLQENKVNYWGVDCLVIFLSFDFFNKL